MYKLLFGRELTPFQMFSSFAKLLKCSVIIRAFYAVIKEMTQITSSSNNSSRAGKEWKWRSKSGERSGRPIIVLIQRSSSLKAWRRGWGMKQQPWTAREIRTSFGTLTASLGRDNRTAAQLLVLNSFVAEISFWSEPLQPIFNERVKPFSDWLGTHTSLRVLINTEW